MRISARGLLIWAVVVGVVVGLAGSSAADDDDKYTWKVSKLASPSTKAKGWFPNDIASNGLIGGGWLDENQGFHAAYWKKGKGYDVATEIGLPSGATNSNILSVNSSGLMGGNATGAIYGAVLWDLKKDKYYDLHPDDPTGAFYVASNVAGVNERGDAVGWVVRVPAADADNPLGYDMLPWIWPKKNRDGYALPSQDDFWYATCSGINSCGVVSGVGIVKKDSGPFEFHALLWKKNKKGKYELYDLQDEEFDGSDYVESEANDVSEKGEVVGRAWEDPGVVPAVPYSWKKKGGIKALDIDTESYGIAWKAVGKYVAGGIGQGTELFGQGFTDDAVVWVKGKLHVVVKKIGDFTNCEASR